MQRTEEKILTEELVIAGGHRLCGEVRVSGAKNFVLKLMAAALLAPGETVLYNVPHIRDVFSMMELLNTIGVETALDVNGVLRLQVPGTLAEVVPEARAKEMRASIQVLGPLLARQGAARIGSPGGCAIGERPIDLHVSGLERLGAHVELGAGCVAAQAKGGLRGNVIRLAFPSVGATENLLMAATLAKGETVIHGAAREPEIIEVQSFLRKMGARVTGAGSDTIRVQGVRRLYPTEHRVMPDRIEAGTFMIGAALTGGDVMIYGAVERHLGAVMEALKETGARVDVYAGDAVRVRSTGRPAPVRARAEPFPGFPTDLQPPLTALLSVANGTSVVEENVFSDRFRYVEELRKLGAKIEVQGRVAVIHGVSRLIGAPCRATDLRAGAALSLAALRAEGVTFIRDIHFVDRGYERFVGKLQGLGARIRRVQA